MRITASTVNLKSSQISLKTVESSEQLRQWGLSQGNNSANNPLSGQEPKQKDIFASSFGSNFLSSNTAQGNSGLDQDDAFNQMKNEFIGNVKEEIMKDMIEMITGKKIKILSASDLTDTGNTPPPNQQQAPANPNQTQQPKPQGWGIDYSYKATTTTTSGVAVAASGTVTTANGTTINFSASLQMTNQTTSETSISVKAGDALIDPLMVDLSGSGVKLSDATFSFDLNADGKAETINAPDSQSGFLAYDKNGNGVIDNGSELFGPKSGNGFADLAKYDSDKNGWIDENDAVFNNLKIWQKASDGTDSLTSLKDNGIGAIYLGSTASKFDITNQSIPDVAGIVRQTGLFLRENGPSGFIQEVDLKA